MKRSAERQLTKDDADDEIQEIQDPRGFQKADDSALANRPIRALPKRALKPPVPNGLGLAPEVDSLPPPRFGTFGGFGSGASTSSPFVFSPSSSVQPNPSLASPFSGPLKQSPSDSDGSLPKSGPSSPAEEADAGAFKYFKSIRGLNVSFLSAISSAVEKDPFFDVASLAESYKNLRTTIQSEFDSSPQPSTSHTLATTNSASLFTGKPPPEKITPIFTMPKPLVGSTETSLKLAATSEGGVKNGGFTFPPFQPAPASTPAPVPFGLTPKPSESFTPSSITPPEPSKSPFKLPPSSTPASTSSLPPASGLSPAVPSVVENTTPELTPSQETLSQAAPTPSFGSSGVPNFFTTSKHTSVFATSDATSKPSSIFGGSIFGSSSTAESNKLPPFNPPVSDDKESSRAPTSLFGDAPSTSTSTNVFGSSSDKPVSLFGSASPAKTSGFMFGKPGGSIGNPVGFGFGSSASSTGEGSSSSGFTFGAPSTKQSESLFSPPMSSESTPQPEVEGTEEGGEEEAVKLLPSQTHDHEGEGEEDEETMHVVKCKVYRLTKSEEKSEWKDLGIGMLRLKKHKETNVRRVLMRNSSTGRILINFRIHASFKSSLAKTGVSFVGHENSMPTSYRIRVKTEEQAEELKQAMDREIAVVQAAK